MSRSSVRPCPHLDSVGAHALLALSAAEAKAMNAHLPECPECRQELAALSPAVVAMAAWPTDVLRPAAPLWERVAQRIGADANVPPGETQWQKPEWEEVAPGITCKLLATDAERGRVSMLVRLGPGVEYPPHRHAGMEELHLLDGELWIDERKLFPGDYSHAEAGTADKRVWSETGCTCVLITSPDDVLGLPA